MTYQDIKTALRTFQAQGYTIPALNSKREILESALIQIQAMTAVAEDSPAVAPVVTIEPETIEEVVEISMEPTTEVITPVDILTTEVIPQAQENTLEPLPSEPFQFTTIKPITRTVTGWQLLKLEITDDLRFVGTVLIWGVALVRSLIRFTSPYAKRAANFALRAAVYGVVAFRLFVLPKIMIRLYVVGIWGLETILRTSRKLSIA